MRNKQQHMLDDIDDVRGTAFENSPLSIGYGQTISQPYIVAQMTDLLAPEPEHYILEIGTGYHGWPEHAPYDGIMVTAAATHIPAALLEQLKPDGCLVIPVALFYSHQELMLLTKDLQGETEVESLLGVAFVPLVEQMPAEQ